MRSLVFTLLASMAMATAAIANPPVTPQTTEAALGPSARAIPSPMLQYRQEIQSSAWATLGLNAPVAALAAQAQQESGGRADAVSRVGAQGLLQFMPATAADMGRRYPSVCFPVNTLSAKWSIRCSHLYMRELLKAVPAQSDDCARWVYAWRAYNGGLGWIRRDVALAAAKGVQPEDWRSVAKYNAGRSGANFRENTEYPHRILKLAIRYVEAKWGTTVCLPKS
jgi:membrane-bound lytic murein transglycosylase MltF